MRALERDRRGDGGEARPGGRGLLSPPVAPVLALAMVVFDLDVGQLVEDVYPDGALSPEECRDIAFHAFPDTLSRVSPALGSVRDTRFFSRTQRRGTPRPGAHLEAADAARSAARGESRLAALAAGAGAGGAAAVAATRAAALARATDDSPEAHRRARRLRRLANTPSPTHRFLYFASFCRQRRDERLRRGGEQRAVVVVSPWPLADLLGGVARVVGPEALATGPRALRRAARRAARWPPLWWGRPATLWLGAHRIDACPPEAATLPIDAFDDARDAGEWRAAKAERVVARVERLNVQAAAQSGAGGAVGATRGGRGGQAPSASVGAAENGRSGKAPSPSLGAPDGGRIRQSPSPPAGPSPEGSALDRNGATVRSETPPGSLPRVPSESTLSSSSSYMPSLRNESDSEVSADSEDDTDDEEDDDGDDSEDDDDTELDEDASDASDVSGTLEGAAAPPSLRDATLRLRVGATLAPTYDLSRTSLDTPLPPRGPRRPCRPGGAGGRDGAGFSVDRNGRRDPFDSRAARASERAGSASDEPGSPLGLAGLPPADRSRSSRSEDGRSESSATASVSLGSPMAAREPSLAQALRELRVGSRRRGRGSGSGSGSGSAAARSGCGESPRSPGTSKTAASVDSLTFAPPPLAVVASAAAEASRRSASLSPGAVAAAASAPPSPAPPPGPVPGAAVCFPLPQLVYSPEGVPVPPEVLAESSEEYDDAFLDAYAQSYSLARQGCGEVAGYDEGGAPVLVPYRTPVAYDERGRPFAVGGYDDEDRPLSAGGFDEHGRPLGPDGTGLDAEGRPVLLVSGCDRQGRPVAVQAALDDLGRLVPATDVYDEQGNPIAPMPYAERALADPADDQGPGATMRPADPYGAPGGERLSRCPDGRALPPMALHQPGLGRAPPPFSAYCSPGGPEAPLSSSSSDDEGDGGRRPRRQRRALPRSERSRATPDPYGSTSSSSDEGATLLPALLQSRAMRGRGRDAGRERGLSRGRSGSPFPRHFPTAEERVEDEEEEERVGEATRVGGDDRRRSGAEAGSGDGGRSGAEAGSGDGGRSGAEAGSGDGGRSGAEAGSGDGGRSGAEAGSGDRPGGAAASLAAASGVGVGGVSPGPPVPALAPRFRLPVWLPPFPPDLDRDTGLPPSLFPRTAGQALLSPGPFAETDLYGALKASLTNLWALWERAALGEPILVLGASPAACSAAVAAIVSVMAPLPEAHDFRPYLTIQDPCFSRLAADNAARARAQDPRKQPPVGKGLPRIVGMTNLYALRALSTWGNVVTAGFDDEAAAAAARGALAGDAGAGGGADLPAARLAGGAPISGGPPRSGALGGYAASARSAGGEPAPRASSASPAPAPAAEAAAAAAQPSASSAIVARPHAAPAAASSSAASFFSVVVRALSGSGLAPPAPRPAAPAFPPLAPSSGAAAAPQPPPARASGGGAMGIGAVGVGGIGGVGGGGSGFRPMPTPSSRSSSSSLSRLFGNRAAAALRALRPGRETAADALLSGDPRDGSWLSGATSTREDEAVLAAAGAGRGRGAAASRTRRDAAARGALLRRHLQELSRALLFPLLAYVTPTPPPPPPRDEAAERFARAALARGPPPLPPLDREAVLDNILDRAGTVPEPLLRAFRSKNALDAFYERFLDADTCKQWLRVRRESAEAWQRAAWAQAALHLGLEEEIKGWDL